MRGYRGLPQFVDAKFKETKGVYTTRYYYGQRDSVGVGMRRRKKENKK